MQRQWSSIGKQNRATIRSQQSETVNPITEKWESLPGCKQLHTGKTAKCSQTHTKARSLRLRTNTDCSFLQVTRTQMYLQRLKKKRKLHHRFSIYVTSPVCAFTVTFLCRSLAPSLPIQFHFQSQANGNGRQKKY